MLYKAALSIGIHDHDPFSIPEDWDVRVVRSNDELVEGPSLAQGWDQRGRDECVVEMILRLIHYQWVTSVTKEYWKYNGASLPN